MLKYRAKDVKNMDEKNALRQLPEIQNIAEYLRNMEFRKKLVGGVDAESVLEHFSAVTLQYEAIISAFMRQADVYARRLAEAEALLRGQEGERAPMAAQPAQPRQWYGAACPQEPPLQLVQPQPMPQPCAAQNPWEQVCSPWAQPAPQEYNPAPQEYNPFPQDYNPWAPQAYAPAPLANPWQDAESLPEQPSYLYA